MGETWFFRPDTKVTREEFLAMAMDLVDLDALPEGGDHRVCRRGQYLRLGPLCGLGFPGGMVQGTGTQAGGTTLIPAAPSPAPRRRSSWTGCFKRRMWPTPSPGGGGRPRLGLKQSVVNLEAVGVLTPEK